MLAKSAPSCVRRGGRDDEDPQHYGDPGTRPGACHEAAVQGPASQHIRRRADRGRHCAEARRGEPSLQRRAFPRRVPRIPAPRRSTSTARVSRGPFSTDRNSHRGPQVDIRDLARDRPEDPCERPDVYPGYRQILYARCTSRKGARCRYLKMGPVSPRLSPHPESDADNIRSRGFRNDQ